jgi:hypothetical protein
MEWWQSIPKHVQEDLLKDTEYVKEGRIWFENQKVVLANKQNST